MKAMNIGDVQGGIVEEKMEEQGIDFVIAWVNGNDPEWHNRKKAYTEMNISDFSTDNTIDSAEERYRDWGFLPYWFRSVAAFAPWVRKVWLICDQNPPEWLNQECDRLTVVRHEDYLPGEYRPAFSSHPIELNLHRIEGLSERFVYFNDDMFLLLPVREDFFFRNGLPTDAAVLSPVPTTALKLGRSRIFTIPLNNMEYLNRDYDFHSCIRKNFRKWICLSYGKDLLKNLLMVAWPRFTGFYEFHLPQPFLKKTFEEAWKQDWDVLDATSRHPIRNDLDVNQWLIREHQLAEGWFEPRSSRVGKDFPLDAEYEDAEEAIRGQKWPMICLNDAPMSQNEFENRKQQILIAFQSILPDPCIFEKESNG